MRNAQATIAQPNPFAWLEQHFLTPRKISRRQLADESGVARSRIEKLFDGRKIPTDDELLKIEEAVRSLEVKYLSAHPQADAVIKENQELSNFVHQVYNEEFIGLDHPKSEAEIMQHRQKRVNGRTAINDIARTLTSARIDRFMTKRLEAELAQAELPNNTGEEPEENTII